MSRYIDINKFHTISITKYILSKIDPKEITIRSLLISYLRLSSSKYKTEEEIVRVCEDLYDFKFEVRGDMHGSYFMIVFKANAIDPKYIHDDTYTLDKIYNLFQDLSTPLIVNHTFDKKTFLTAKKHLKATILKMDKYLDVKASNFAFHTFFLNTLRDFKPMGDIEELDKITIEDLYAYYNKISKDENVCYFLGDFNGKYPYNTIDDISPKLDHNFIDRGLLDKNLYLMPYKSKQMYLRIIYDINIFSGDLKIYPFILLNYFLGASNYSYLFQKIREEYGLCYSISSELYGASGILMIRSEIKKKDLDFVLERIDECISEGIHYMDIDKIKRMITLTHKASYDLEESYLFDELCKDFFPAFYDGATYIDRINSVTMEDIKDAFLKLKNSRRVIFGFGGDLNER